MMHDYILQNNIDLMEMKSQLIILSMKSGDEVKKHKLAIELGNDLFTNLILGVEIAIFKS